MYLFHSKHCIYKTSKYQLKTYKKPHIHTTSKTLSYSKTKVTLSSPSLPLSLEQRFLSQKQLRKKSKTRKDKTKVYKMDDQWFDRIKEINVMVHFLTIYQITHSQLQVDHGEPYDPIRKMKQKYNFQPPYRPTESYQHVQLHF